MKKRKIKTVFPIMLLITAILAGMALLVANGYRRYQRTAYPLGYTDLIMQYSDDYGITPSLVCAVICVESHFQPDAASHAQAIGLMQLTEDTFHWAQTRAGIKEKQGAEALTDPETNIRFGVYTLKLLYEQFDDTKTVLAAYNAGQGNVRRWLADKQYSADGVHLDRIPYAETENYVKRVEKAQTIYRKLYALH